MSWSAYNAWARGGNCAGRSLRARVTAFTERGGTAHRVRTGPPGRDQGNVGRLAQNLRDGTLFRGAQFQTAMRPRRRRVEQGMAAALGRPVGLRKTAATCRDGARAGPGLLDVRRRARRRADDDAAERALRPAVLWRKSCFGTHSSHGRRFVERIAHRGRRRSGSSTGTSSATYVTHACVAALHWRLPHRSILPLPLRPSELTEA